MPVAALRGVAGLDKGCRVTTASFIPDMPTEAAGMAGDLPGLTLQQGTQTFDTSAASKRAKGGMARRLCAQLEVGSSV